MEAPVLEKTWSEWTAWWNAAPPEFVFLLALPLVVGCAGFVAERFRCRRQ